MDPSPAELAVPATEGFIGTGSPQRGVPVIPTAQLADIEGAVPCRSETRRGVA
jgi:hypothetical protein